MSLWLQAMSFQGSCFTGLSSPNGEGTCVVQCRASAALTYCVYIYICIYIFNVYTSLYIHNTTREQCLSAPQQLHRRGQAALGAPPAVSSASVAAVHHGSRRDIPTMVAPARLLIHASPSLYQLLHPSACSLDIEERHSLLKTYIYIYIHICIYI